MDYEKKYKEALERARQFSEHPLQEDSDSIVEYIFPELAESEDEKIRKALIEYFNEQCDMSDWNGVYGYQVVAWLEKQGEQNPADKVEPKFKVGDWITDGEAIFHITSYDIDYGYQLETAKGTLFHFSNENVENKYHLWTIQDAKDGDVLSYNDSRNNVWVCIFKEYANERVYDYCTLDKESFWEHNNWNYLASFNYTPATKEQCDLLFAKIRENGYEWDVEKKELKKIEQKPAWSEENEVKINRIVACLENLNVADNDILLKDIDWLKSLRPQNRWKPSDEQMKALKDVREGVFRFGILESLYQDLMKLKG